MGFADPHHSFPGCCLSWCRGSSHGAPSPWLGLYCQMTFWCCYVEILDFCFYLLSGLLFLLFVKPPLCFSISISVSTFSISFSDYHLQLQKRAFCQPLENRSSVSPGPVALPPNRQRMETNNSACASPRSSHLPSFDPSVLLVLWKWFSTRSPEGRLNVTLVFTHWHRKCMLAALCACAGCKKQPIFLWKTSSFSERGRSGWRGSS